MQKVCFILKGYLKRALHTYLTGGIIESFSKIRITAIFFLCQLSYRRAFLLLLFFLEYVSHLFY